VTTGEARTSEHGGPGLSIPGGGSMSKVEIKVDAAAVAGFMKRRKVGPIFVPPLKVKHTWASVDGKTALFDQRRIWTAKSFERYLNKFVS
jgi:hypothetical protein